MRIDKTLHIINRMDDINRTTLRDHVKQTLENYFSQLDGHKPANLYAMVLQEVEIPLLTTVLKHTKNNQSKAANMLGISRGTFRKKAQILEDFLV